MALREEFVKQGDWLFRWRSFLPLLLLPLAVYALMISADSGYTWGHPADTIYSIVCVAISFSGMLIRAMTIGYIPPGTSGGNTLKQRARTLNTTGIYSIVRHPLYLGNFVIFLGIVLFVGVWWLVIISTLLFWLYYERIMYREEEFLREKFSDVYLEWSERTPAFFPRIQNWKRSNLRFSLWRIIKREYRGFFEIIAVFTLFAVVGDYLQKGEYVFHPGWTFFFGVGFLVFIIIRIITKIRKHGRKKGRKQKHS